jgi:nucleoside-diphosphate-sugar epimerase
VGVYISIHTLAPQKSITSDKELMDIELDGLKNVVKGCQTRNVKQIIYVAP